MKVATRTIELDEINFNKMEEVLLKNGCEKLKKSFTPEQWDYFVIDRYYDTVPYLEWHNNNLEKAYIDMTHDF